MADRPNILFFHVDNLGFGELSCYSGGPFRGAATSRIDAFAGEGFRLRARSMAHGSGLCGVVRAAADLRRGVVAGRPVVRART